MIEIRSRDAEDRFGPARAVRELDADAPRAEIALAHQRADHSPAVKNFVAVARRAVAAAGQHERHDIATAVAKARVPQR
ncbi:MAG TPA: hypothetical protein VMQ63_08915 [Stellaceae bacterium]|nr:hypothetical protein [Stellaceae bacterium]